MSLDDDADDAFNNDFVFGNGGFSLKVFNDALGEENNTFDFL